MGPRCPRSRVVWYRWPSLALAEDEAEQLSELCRKVPYLGRSTCPVIVEVTEEDPVGLGRVVPRDQVSEPQVFAYLSTVRCPEAGSLAYLRDAYDEKYNRGGTGYPWEIGIGIDYGTVSSPKQSAIVSGPYRIMVVFAIEGRILDGRHTARVTSAVRRAILGRADTHIATLHGHHEGDVVQCAFLGLPFVGSEHADGHLLGVAVAIPDLSSTDLGVLHRALPSPGDILEVTAGPLGVLSLRRVSPVDAENLPWGLQPERWTGPALVWKTALPMVFDRFLPRGNKRGDDLTPEVRNAIQNSRLPETQEIAVSLSPLIQGGLDLAPTDTLRRAQDKGFKGYRHIAVRFDHPVRGPVVIGSMRHYGLGLCVPVDDEEPGRG